MDDKNLNSRPYDDTHEEVGDDAGYCHHQALDYGDARIEAQYEEEIVREARVEMDHKIADSSRDEGDQDQERHCRDRVADHKSNHAVVPVQPLPLENLLHNLNNC